MEREDGKNERKNLLFFLSAPNFLPHLTGGTPRRCPCPLSPRRTLPASPPLQVVPVISMCWNMLESYLWSRRDVGIPQENHGLR